MSVENKTPAPPAGTRTIAGQESLTNLLKRTGRFYIPLIVALIQLPFLPAAAIGAAIIQVNAQLTTEQIKQSGVAALVAILVGYALILGFIFAITRQANERLATWARTGSLPGSAMETGISRNSADEERLAWKQIASLPWNYGIATSVIFIFVDIAPVIAYQYYTLGIVQSSR